MRVIVLTHGGAEGVVNSILPLSQVRIVGIFVEIDIVRRYGIRELIERSVRYDGYAATARKFCRRLLRAGRPTEAVNGSQQSRDALQRIAQSQQIPFHLVDNYHSPETIQLISSTRPDLGVIYGTNIIEESVFKIPGLGSINLHQGLAPYYRGGPPVFWELYNDESAVGLTVHFVEAKVDSGPIILQETVPLRYDYHYGSDYEAFVADFLSQLRDRCARLMAEAVHLIALGKQVSRPQDASLGKRYRLPLKVEKDELRRRLQARRVATAADRSADAKI